MIFPILSECFTDKFSRMTQFIYLLGGILEKDNEVSPSHFIECPSSDKNQRYFMQSDTILTVQTVFAA